MASGTHYFRVVAYNEYGYSVSWSSPYSPVIVSLPPRGLHLSSTADNPDPDGQFNLNWNVSTDADYYFVYEYTSLITEINGSLDLIGNNLTVNTLLREGYGMGDYYFMVVASNEIGTQNSNCIKITVGEPALSFWEILERYGLFIGLIAGSIILAIALIIRKKIPKGIRVFISHAVNDFESYRIEQLAKYLESQKEISHVYYCEEDLIGDIDDLMMKTVPKCQLLIFFSSNNSLNSADCIMELRLALKHNIQVTPILGIDMDWKDLELKWEDLKLDLSRQLGKEFNPDEFDKFNKDLYSYILKVKQDLEKEIIEKKKGKKRK